MVLTSNACDGGTEATMSFTLQELQGGKSYSNCTLWVNPLITGYLKCPYVAVSIWNFGHWPVGV